MSKLGTAKIEAIASSVKTLLIAGKKISADKKVDLSDLPHAVALVPQVPAMVESFKAFGEAFEEAKDIDVAEAVALVQALHKMVKEVEAA